MGGVEGAVNFRSSTTAVEEPLRATLLARSKLTCTAGQKFILLVVYIQEYMSVADILLHEKPRKVLRFIREKGSVSIYDVSQSTDTAYAHTFNLIKKLTDAGIVTANKSGRRVEVSITELGERICRLVDEIERLSESDSREMLDAGAERLARYREKVREVVSRSESGECRNARLLLGRYRQVVRRMRPRSRAGRRMRREVLEEIEDALCRLKR